MEKLIIDGRSLTIADVFKVANAKPGEIQVEISKDAIPGMQSSRNLIDEIVKSGKVVYGINTGFGALSNQKIDAKDLEQLQYNLVRSHCTGVGKPFDKEISRAIMILRANCLVTGFSGVTIEVVQLLVDFINHHVTPVIPSKGSVGASGDLAPLSHIALALIGEGEVEYEGKEIRSSFALEQIGKPKARLFAKDGLALINGTAVMTALGSIAIHRITNIIKTADIIASLTLDAVRGSVKAFDKRISALKPFESQMNVCINFENLLKDSNINNSHHECHRVQDPYSLRCVPQVHGAIRQTINHARDILSIEVNSVTDNPLVFVETGDVISGGNFHGEAIALAMDYLTMGVAELANICERRIEKMMNPIFSELPAFLVKEPGLNSGLMIAHVTTAALVSENKVLCHPASVDSIPTSTDKEDHVSMGVTSGRKLIEVLDNTTHCLAIELLCNTQAIEFLRPLKTSKPLEAVYKLIRLHVKPIEVDRILYKDIEKINGLLRSNDVLNVVEDCIGKLK
jgi:histidine ammonia-lyase